MHRNSLLNLLHAYQPTQQETLHKKTIIEFIERNPDCFERSLEIGHITASAWLLNKDHSHALLMHHTKLDKWLQLGGHCDGDSDVLAVAIKEAQEESGITTIVPVHNGIFDIDVHLIPARAHEKEHYHYDIRFLLQVMSDEECVRNNESKALQWIAKDRQALPQGCSSVARMFDKWMQI